MTLRGDPRRIICMVRTFGFCPRPVRADQRASMPASSREEETMLKTLVISFLAIAMSVGFADARGRHVAKPKPPAMSCNAEQPSSAPCACGPSKTVCQKGQFCHSIGQVVGQPG